MQSKGVSYLVSGVQRTCRQQHCVWIYARRRILHGGSSAACQLFTVALSAHRSRSRDPSSRVVIFMTTIQPILPTATAREAMRDHSLKVGGGEWLGWSSTGNPIPLKWTRTPHFCGLFANRSG